VKKIHVRILIGGLVLLAAAAVWFFGVSNPALF
jgi:hypothetical protein